MKNNLLTAKGQIISPSTIILTGSTFWTEKFIANVALVVYRAADGHGAVREAGLWVDWYGGAWTVSWKERESELKVMN